MAGKISVVIPTRDRPDLLARSLRSISLQTHAAIELVVVDDSSTEGLCAENLALVQSLFPAALYLKLPPAASGRGPAFTRNHGIEHCGGDFVAFLDDDDEWIDPCYLEVAIGAMTRHGFDVHFANQEAMSTDGRIEPSPVWIEDWATLLPRAGSRAAPDGSFRVSVESALSSNGFAHLNTTIVSLALLRDGLGGFDDRIIYEGDRELYFRLLDQAESIGYTPRLVSRHHIPFGASRVSVSNKVSAEEKDASRLRWLDNLVRTARRDAVRRRCQREQGYTLRRIAKRAAKRGNFVEARQYGLEALTTSFGFKWFGYVAWLHARTLLSPRRATPRTPARQALPRSGLKHAGDRQRGQVDGDWGQDDPVHGGPTI